MTNNKIKIIKIIVIIFFVIISITGAYNEIQSEMESLDWEMIKNTYSETEIILEILLLSVLSFVAKFFPCIVILFAINISKKKYDKERLSKIDLKEYENYYRDILKGYSPGALSFIDDFKLEDKDIVSTLLSIKLKGKINIGENIEILNNNIQLSYSEQYVLEKINNGHLNVNILEFEKIVQKEIEEAGLVKQKSLGILLKRIIIFVIVGIVSLILPFVATAGVEEGEFLTTFQTGILLISVLTVIFLPLYAIAYIINYFVKFVNSPYIRSKKGEEINEKLEGLKKYLEDYGSLDKKGHEELVLWDEYLIYSVMFGQNKEIVNEIMKKYVEKK